MIPAAVPAPCSTTRRVEPYTARNHSAAKATPNATIGDGQASANPRTAAASMTSNDSGSVPVRYRYTQDVTRAPELTTTNSSVVALAATSGAGSVSARDARTHRQNNQRVRSTRPSGRRARAHTRTGRSAPTGRPALTASTTPSAKAGRLTASAGSIPLRVSRKASSPATPRSIGQRSDSTRNRGCRRNTPGREPPSVPRSDDRSRAGMTRSAIPCGKCWSASGTDVEALVKPDGVLNTRHLPEPATHVEEPFVGNEGLFHGLPYYSTSMSDSKLRILAVRTRRPPLLDRACRGAISTRRRSPYGTPDDSVRQAGFGKVVPGLGLEYGDHERADRLICAGDATGGKFDIAHLFPEATASLAKRRNERVDVGAHLRLGSAFVLHEEATAGLRVLDPTDAGPRLGSRHCRVTGSVDEIETVTPMTRWRQWRAGEAEDAHGWNDGAQSDEIEIRRADRLQGGVEGGQRGATTARTGGHLNIQPG